MHKNWLLALAALALFAAGCGRSEKKYKTPGGEVTVSQKGDQVSYEGSTKEGKFKMAVGDKGVALPEGFPKDVPLLKDATVKVAMTQGMQTIVHLHGAVGVGDAAKFYEDQLKMNGWTVENTMNMGDSSMVIAKKGARQCNVVAAKEGDGTLVQLAVSQEGQ